METFRRALGNSGIMLLSQVITWTATLILTGALARYLGDAGFGELYLAISMGLIFSVVVNFGLDQQLTRALARDPDLTQSYLINSISIKTVTAGVAYLIMVGLTYLLDYPATVRHTIFIYAAVLFLAGYSASFTAAFQAHEYMIPPAIATMVEKIFVAVAAIICLILGYGILAVAAMYVAGATLNVLCQLTLAIRRFGLRSARLNPEVIRLLVVGALPFFLFWVLGSVYYRVDVVLLSKMTDANVVGWYGAAYRLFDTLVFLPNIISIAIVFPILARLSERSRENFSLALGRGLQMMMIVGLPLCTGLFTLARPIITFVYGKPEFLPAVPALRWLSLGLFVLYLNSILGVAIMSLNKEKKMTIGAGIAIGFNLTLNLLLIPHYQQVAAAATTFLTELMLFGYLVYYLPRDLQLRSSVITFLKLAVAAGAMGLVLWLLRDKPLILLVPLGGLVYAAVGLAIGAVPRQDVRLLTQLMTRRETPAPIESDAVNV